MSVRADLIAKLYRGADPLANLTQTQPPDFQGWNSWHPYLFDAVKQHRPGIMVEVGVWKGCSTLELAKGLRNLDCDGVVIAVDTWLGSAEHWPVEGLYEQFLANVCAEQLRDYILPLRLDSASAASLLFIHNVRPHVVHLDASHDYFSVSADLMRYWKLLQPGGMMIVDEVWPEVVQAVYDFLSLNPYLSFGASSKKCRFVKPK